MRILVIEDKELHRQAAKQTISGHKLTIVKSFDKAMELMEETIDKNEFQRLMTKAGFKEKPSLENEELWNKYWDEWDKAKKESMSPFPFEVVLTDMMMPMSLQTLSPEVFRLNEQVPYGFIIALQAAYRGAKYVAMVTDTNHHQGAMSAAIDHLSGAYYQEGFRPNFEINGAKVSFVHAPFCAVGDTGEKGKDWGQVFKDLIS